MSILNRENNVHTVVSCTNGHTFELGGPGWEFTPDQQIVGSIGYCPIEVAHPTLGNAVAPCEARIVWKRSQVESRPKPAQLELFA